MKFADAAGRLATLQYRTYDLQDLIDIGRSVDNFKKTTLDKIELPVAYDQANNGLVHFKDLSVDIRYQRKMRLKKVVDKLKKHGGFNKDAAGHIDVAIRPDGSMYVWDGFRRAFMAGLTGLESIPASVFRHPLHRSVKECMQYEAKMFKMRNSDNETMKPEEIFRSEVVYGDESAVLFLDFLKECKLDVEELNAGQKALGGFAQVNTAWKNNHVSHDNLIAASKIIQTTWSSDPTVSGYLLCGLGMFLDINDELDYSFDLDDIQESFHHFVNVNPPRKQDALTSRRLNKNPSGSIAYVIASYVMNMDDQYRKDFIKHLNLDSDDLGIIEEN